MKWSEKIPCVSQQVPDVGNNKRESGEDGLRFAIVSIGLILVDFEHGGKSQV
jgi:hypothetical protein